MQEQTEFWYKIVEFENGKVRTLFHGINNSRTIPTETWLTADKKMVNDGKGPLYLSGWHVLPTYDLCEKYLTRFKNRKTKAIFKCLAKDLRPKKHSKSKVFLADHILILTREDKK